MLSKKPTAGSRDPQRQASGRVLDPSGHPIVGATVEPVGVRKGDSASFGQIEGLDPLAVTNERGEFRFQCPKAGSTLIALVKARGLAPQIVSTLNTGARVPQDVSMTYGTTVAGTVQSMTGQKMAGVTVQVVPADLNAETFVGWFEIGTDQEGKFSLPNIPANRQYVICARMDTLVESGLGVVQHPLTTGKDDTTTGALHFVAMPASTVTGRVVLTDGKPIPAGTRLMLGRAETWDEQQAIVAEDGGFTFRGVPREENMELVIRVPNHHYAENTPGYDSTYHNVRLKIPATSSKTNIQINLAPNSK